MKDALSLLDPTVTYTGKHRAFQALHSFVELFNTLIKKKKKKQQQHPNKMIRNYPADG